MTSPDLTFCRSHKDPVRLIPRALTKLYSLWVCATYPFAHRGRGISVHYTCEIDNPHLIEIGSLTTLHKDVHLDAATRHEGKGPLIVIGDRCAIWRGSQISASNSIHLESDIVIATSVLITDHLRTHDDPTSPIRDQGYTKGGRIRIGRGCWIGHGATIVCESGELTLGCNCIVAANSLLTRSAPAYSVLAGNPARIVKQFDPVKGEWVLGASRTITTDRADVCASVSPSKS